MKFALFLSSYPASRELLAIAGETAKKDMVVALKARRSVLEDRLREKMEELKKICINEAVSLLTGFLCLHFPLLLILSVVVVVINSLSNSHNIKDVDEPRNPHPPKKNGKKMK